MRKIIAYAWYEHKGICFGIIITSRVIVEGDKPVKRAFIGIGLGHDEQQDLQSIAALGGDFNLQAAEICIKEKGTYCEIKIES